MADASGSDSGAERPRPSMKRARPGSLATQAQHSQEHFTRKQRAEHRQQRQENDDAADTELSALLFGAEDTVLRSFGKESRTKQQPNDDSDTDSDDSSTVKARQTDNGGSYSAWQDADDETVQVDISARARLRKLRETESEGALGGEEFEKRLRQRFVKSNMGQEWAQVQTVQERADSSDDDAEYGPEESDLFAASGSFLGDSQQKLQPGYLNLIRCKDANQHDPSKSVVKSVNFHASGELMLTAGLDRTLRFFQIDGVDNPKVHGLHFKDLPIECAAFAANDQVIVAGEKPYFYFYDVESGAIQKVPQLQSSGKLRPEKLSRFAVSPCGQYIAFITHSCYITLVSNRTKQWAADFKANGTVQSVAFSPDSQFLLAAGKDSEVYKFDLRSRNCLLRMYNEGGTGAPALAVHGDGSHGYTAVGTESGVVNVYSQNALHQQISARPAATSVGVMRPKPAHAIMNLTTPVSCVKFNRDAQIMAIASNDKRDALKLVHMPSGTVFSNWPTERTPIRYPFSLDFSPDSSFLAVGNDRGRVLLYRLRHYSQS